MTAWRNIFNRRACISLLAISIIAPFVYVFIQGYGALLDGPLLSAFGVRSRMDFLVGIAAINCVGALVAAVVLAGPMAILARQKSSVLGLCLGIITIATFAVQGVIKWNSDLLGLAVVEYVAFVIFCAVTAYIFGGYFAPIRARPTGRTSTT